MLDKNEKPQVLVLGGGSMVGGWLLPLLARAGYRGHVVSRDRKDGVEGFEWLSALEVQNASWHLKEKAVIVSLWPIWLLAPVMPQFPGASQLVALSSTSLFGKAGSLDRVERQLVENLASAEKKVRVSAETFRIPYTILRPTLIYDCIRDHSINFIARIIRNFGFFMVAGGARGLRQPVHAEDVAKAILASIGNGKAYNKSINITGGEAITCYTMIRRVAEAVGRRPRIIPSPVLLLKAMMMVARFLGLTNLSPSLFDRMNQDLAYDSREAGEILGFKARPFHPEFPK